MATTPEQILAKLEKIKQTDKDYFVGCDEVGYGCLAGPLVVAGVRAPKGWVIPGLNDSKKLTEKRREAMKVALNTCIEQGEITWHLAERSNTHIDKHGVAVSLKDAYIECMHKLYQKDSLIVTDGILKFDGLGVDAYDKVNLIKADAHLPAVMAASILAKTYRDKQMKEVYHPQYPKYDWASNVGYAAEDHLKAIEEHGPCVLHRFSYAPMRLMDLTKFKQLDLPGIK